MTQAEKRRLAELLREIDEEEDDTARGADSKVGRQEALTCNICCRMSLSFSSFFVLTLCVSEALCKSTVGGDDLISCLLYQHIDLLSTYNKTYLEFL